jgi:Cu2+-exporting ATPase
LATYTANGYTPVAIAVDGQCRAVLAFGDRIRTDSRAVIARWQAEGKAVYLLSGDHAQVVAQVANSLAIPPAHAMGEVSPEEKRAFVEKLCAHSTVAMIGDGVNDAAALQAAHVGIAVQGGSTPSLVAADVFLTQEGLRPVRVLLEGSQQTMQVVRRNLGLSLLYNGLGASAALLGLVTPLVAAIAMPISSLVVVLSSILQQTFQPLPTLVEEHPAGGIA